MPINDCEQFAKRLSSYTDGEMDKLEKERWEQHLRTCAACSTLLRRVKDLGEQLRNLPQVKVSPDFNVVLRARIRMEQHRRVWPQFLTEPLWGWRLPAFGAAAVLFLAVSLVVFSQFRQNNTNAHKMIVLTPITGSQSRDLYKTKQVVDTSVTKPRINYVLDRVTLDDLLKDRKGVALSSEGLAELERSRSDSLRRLRHRANPPTQYVTHRRTGVRF